MTRIAFFADSQVDEHSRLAEHDRCCEFVARDAAARGCDLLLHGGDVFERRSTERERASVRAWIRTACEEGLDVAIVGGNHEAPGEVEELAWHGIEGLAHGEPLALFATETPCVRVLGDAEPVAVGFLPWPRRAHVARWLEAVSGRVPSREEISEATPELLRQILRGLGQQLAAVPPEVPRILLAHVQVSGAQTDPDQPGMVGCDMELSIEDLMLAGADACLLGHIHMPQAWVGLDAGHDPADRSLIDGRLVSTPAATCPVIYAGSPRRTAYAKGELVPKGYVVLEWEGRRLVKWERVPTPATPMMLVEATWRGATPKRDIGGGMSVETFSTFHFADGVDVWAAARLAGAEIRFRYSVAADEREAARRAAEAASADWLARGAAEVKLDEVVEAVTRVRSAEVASATTLRGLIEATWSAQGETAPAAERRPRLLELADQAAAEVAS